MELVIKSFNGLGDSLFPTPAFKVIKKDYPDARIIFNTNYPELVWHNPFIEKIGYEDKGLFLGYDDPIHLKKPTRHNIIADWQIICHHYKLITRKPEISPEIYLEPDWEPPIRTNIGVQIRFKGFFSGKKVWPWFKEFPYMFPFIKGESVKPIPWKTSLIDLVKTIAGYRVVLVEEAGLAHIAKAVGTPAVVVYGGFSSPDWNGYDCNINLTNYPEECGGEPCFNPNPCSFDFKCMKSILPSMVVKAIEETLCPDYQSSSPLSMNTRN